MTETVLALAGYKRTVKVSDVVPDAGFSTPVSSTVSTGCNVGSMIVAVFCEPPPISALVGALGAPGGSTSTVPAGSSIHATAHIEINYHDFDVPVTIAIPTVG